jgi:hypothetical protein
VRVRLGLLLVLGFLIAGTTVTNALFVVLCLGCLRRQFGTTALSTLRLTGPRLAACGVVVLALLVGVGIKYYTKLLHGDTIVTQGLRFRLTQNPVAAAQYALLLPVCPAVGGPPLIAQSGNSLLSYDPFSVSSYSLLSAVGAVAWAGLLGCCFVAVFRDGQLRVYGWVVSLWLAFNMLFHNVWGDEGFLFTPHWSWALMLIVFVGSRTLPLWSLILAAAVVGLGQVDTLVAIRTALLQLGPPA